MQAEASGSRTASPPRGAKDTQCSTSSTKRSRIHRYRSGCGKRRGRCWRRDWSGGGSFAGRSLTSWEMTTKRRDEFSSPCPLNACLLKHSRVDEDIDQRRIEQPVVHFHPQDVERAVGG